MRNVARSRVIRDKVARLHAEIFEVHSVAAVEREPAAFGERQYLFDMALALVFGVIGYIAHKTNYHVTAILIGILLGPLFEQYLVRALRLSQGDLTVLFPSTLGNVLWGFLVLSLALPLLKSYFSRSSPPQP